jgi:exonuclease III
MSDPLPPFDGADAPAPVKAEMLAFRSMLDGIIPPKRDGVSNLLIATWNLKAFSSLTEAWTAKPNQSPKRDWRALWAITEVVSRFDVVALQEVKGDLKALRTMLKTLGGDWQFLMTDVTRGNEGNEERLAFLFDARRIKLSGLACELVVPTERLQTIAPDALSRQFARTPYAVGFRSGDVTFVLVTLHVLYGERAEERAPELKAIAQWMADWAKEATEWEQNLLVLGDFNIDRFGSPLWEALIVTGLTVPEILDQVPRSIFFDEADRADKYYDQIAWFEKGKTQQLNLTCTGGGSIDFVPHLYRDIDLSRQNMQYRVSDHYPLWVEFMPKH